MKKISISDCHTLVQGRNYLMGTLLTNQINQAAAKADGKIDSATLIDIRNVTTDIMRYFDMHANRMMETGNYTKPFYEYPQAKNNYDIDVILEDDDDEQPTDATDALAKDLFDPNNITDPADKYVWRQFSDKTISISQAMKAFNMCECDGYVSAFRRYIWNHIDEYSTGEKSGRRYKLDKCKIATLLLSHRPERCKNLLTYIAVYS